MHARLTGEELATKAEGPLPYPRRNVPAGLDEAVAADCVEPIHGLRPQPLPRGKPQKSPKVAKSPPSSSSVSSCGSA